MASPRKILVPIDFSKGSELAWAHARKEARPEDELHLVHVLPFLAAMHPGVVWSSLDDQERIRTVQQALADFARQHGGGRPPIHVPVSTGNPAVAVADLADRLGVDLVVVASHGRTGLARLAMGSVAEGIVRLCRAPVLVVKAPVEGA